NVEGNIDIYSVADGGTGLERITTGPAIDRDPSWSPDGLRLAFVSGGVDERRIHLIDKDGTDAVRLTDGNAGGTTGDDTSPAWSRDGTRIAFVHESRSEERRVGKAGRSRGSRDQDNTK